MVAVRELPLGTTLTRDCVKLRNVPESLFPKGGFSRVEDVVERPVISTIQADEPVMESRTAARGSGVGLAPLISPGMRAISVRVNDVVGVAGFILPGMRVDVLVTGRPAGAADTFTRTVLQNISVLSAGQTIQTDGKSQTITTPVVTLLVNPSEAEALTLANNEGHIQLVLRNSVDQQISRTSGRQLHELFGSPAGDAPVQASVNAAAGRPDHPPHRAKAGSSARGRGQDHRDQAGGDQAAASRRASRQTGHGSSNRDPRLGEGCRGGFAQRSGREMIRARHLMPAIAVIRLLMADSVARPSVVAVRHWPEGDLTRVAIDVSGDFQFRSERLHHPERIYFDIPGARSPLDNGRPFSEETDDRLLRQIRVAAYSLWSDASGSAVGRRSGNRGFEIGQSEPPRH